MLNLDMDIEELINQGEALRVSLTEINGSLYTYYEYSNYAIFQEWVQKTIRFLHTNFNGDLKIAEFEELSNNEVSPKNHDKLLAILKAFKEIPHTILVPDQERHDGIVINNNQSQSQQQNLVVDVFKESVNDELTGKQMKELIAALKEDKENKKGTIKEKLKTFGLDTLSGIISNIVTNPTVVGTILG